MAIIKCKMCGGTLELHNNETVAVCEYCGTQQTLPKTTDEVTTNLYNRANTLRLKSEFDKAAQTYEKILEVDNAQAEAHWGIILCKYGIEYIEDPATFNRVPTCHRTQLESVMTDADYLAAIEYADATQRAVYEKEAAAIDALQKDILQIVHQEKPFDVFLCYKETDENGKRTPDSVIANDIYYQLTQEGLKVFYAAITLENKLGQEYEPYIFAALNSAKVMLVLGTKPEYFSAVWVKNEWSRFMKLMRADRSKLLIPCYRDMDAYDLPEEFAHLQAQDMSKIGFINDVVRGIRKVVVKEEAPNPAVAAAPAPAAQTGNTAVLLKRAFMFLEDGEWDRADDFCEQVLNIDPECAEAYLGKLMIDLRVKKREDLKVCAKPFDGNSNYVKAVRFADDKLRATLTGIIDSINTRIANAPLEESYSRAKGIMEKASTEEDYKNAADTFATIAGYKDADEFLNICLEKAEVARKDYLLFEAESLMTGSSIANYEEAIEILETIPDWRDADEKILVCRKKIEEIEERLALGRKKMEENAKKTRKIVMIVAPIVCAIIAVALVFALVIIPGNKYDDALSMMGSGRYEEAVGILNELASRNYKDAGDLADQCYFEGSKKYYDEGDYESAIIWYENIDDYDNTAEFYLDSCYNYGLEQVEAKQYELAIAVFNKISEYQDAEEQLLSAKYDFVTGSDTPDDLVIYGYFKELRDADYKDAAERFEETYAWEVELIGCNTDPDDNETTIASIPKEAEYLHMGFALSGGEPGEVITLSHSTQWPSGDERTADWNWEELSSGDYFGAEYPDGFSSYSGTFTIKFYNAADGSIIDSISIPVG